MLEQQTKYRRRSLQEIKKLLKAQAKSGKSIAKFCNDNDTALATFSLWRKKYSKTELPPKFIKINTETTPEINFVGIIKIEQSSTQTSLRTILKTIKGLSL